jgi:hypothetical protein
MIKDQAAKEKRLRDIADRTDEFRDAMRRAGLKPMKLKPPKPPRA